MIPGDPEREAEAIRSKEGIPLLKPVVDDLLDISRITSGKLTLKFSAIDVASTTLRRPGGGGAMARSCADASSAP